MVLRKLVLALSLVLLASPALAAGRELGPRGSGPTAYGVERPLVAFAGGRFLTVWREHRHSIGLPLMGALSDASGRRISTLAFPIIDYFPGIHIQLLGTGDSFALFWTLHDEAFLTDLDLDGRVLRTRALDLPPFLNMRAAWNGSRFLVAMRHPVAETYSAGAVLLERDGALVRALPIQFDSYSFDILPSGSGFTLVAAGFSGVFAYRVTNDGSATEHVVERVTGPTFPAIPIAASTPDGNVLITWSTARGAVGGLKSALLASDGTVSAPRGLFDFRDSQPRPVALVRAGDAYLLIYERFTSERTAVESVRLLADGSVAAPPAETRLVERVSNSNAASNGVTTLIVFNTPAYPSGAASVAVGTDGVARNPETLSLARTRQTQPALGAGGGRFLAVWNDEIAQAAFLRSASAGADAEPLTDNIVAPALLASDDLAWNGTEYLTVVAIDTRRHAVRLSWDGRPLGEPIFLDNFWPRDASVTWAGDRWVVVWTTDETISFVTVSRAGIASKVRQLALPGTFRRHPHYTALAWNGSTLLLAWTETQFAECLPSQCQQTYKTLVARLTTNGELRDAAPLEVPLASSLSLATSGAEFMLLADTTAIAIDASSSPRVIASRRLLNWPASGDITWDGASYAAALRYSGLRWYVSVTHLDRAANEIAPPRGIETLPSDHSTNPPSVASVLAGSAAVAIQEGDVRDGARAVVYTERDMTPLPAPPSPPRHVRVRWIGGGKYEVTWSPSLEGSPEMYRVDGAPDVPANQPLRAIVDRYDVRVRAFNAGGGSEEAVWERVPRRRSSRH